MKLWKRILVGLAGILGLVIVYLLAWPVPIDPEAWTPPKAPELTGVYQINNRLASVERLGARAGIGPETIAIDSQGCIHSGVEGGRILRLQPDGSKPEVLANTGGRPLGLRFDALGNLIVCDAYKGLLAVAPNGSIKVLSTQANGIPFRFTDCLDIAADRTIYFSDASSKFTAAEYVADLMEHRPNGRLLAYYPDTKTTRLVLGKLYFANGVAVSPDQSFILVVETSAYRVRRYWLAGPKQGQSDIFIENLPGFPDNISSNGKDTFWLAFSGSLQSRKFIDAMLPSPFWMKVLNRIPAGLLVIPPNHGFVLGLSQDGRVVHNLQDSSGSYSQTTDVREYQGMLYLGSLVENAIGRLPVPK